MSKIANKSEKLMFGNNHSQHQQAYSKDGVKIVTQSSIDGVLEHALSLERAREPILISGSFDEVPQRFVNCLNEGSYVRPHMHVVPDQWELMSWISGKIVALIFDGDGRVIDKILMSDTGAKLIEIPPFCYHSFYTIGQGAYLEIRNCKYQPAVDRLYSSWAALENSSDAKEYQRMMCEAQIGDIVTIKKMKGY